MDDKLLRLARKIKYIENELSKTAQTKDLEGLLNDIVSAYKGYVTGTQEELLTLMDTLKKESERKTIKDKKTIENLDRLDDLHKLDGLDEKLDEMKNNIKSVYTDIDKSIENIQKKILNNIKDQKDEIYTNLHIKEKEITDIQQQNRRLNSNILDLKEKINNLKLQKGEQGEAGKSAYEIACELGFKGTKEEWIKSLHGKDGQDIELRGMRSFSDAPKDNKTYARKNKKWVEVTGGSGGTSDYSELNNKPLINNIELEGNKTSFDLGLQNATDNTLDTIDKTITGAINEVNSIAKRANQALSYGNYSTMITAFNSLANNIYNVGQNVMIVTLEVPDLWISSIESTSQAYTYVDDATVVSDLQTNGYIQVGYYRLSMLETQKVDLTNYVTDTDYPTSQVAGVIKIGSSYGTAKSSTGNLMAATKNFTEYSSGGNYMLIGKGTLENVITGKGLIDNTYYSDATTTTAGLMSSEDKTKLEGVEIGAEVNVQSNWNETDSTSDSYIKNKPNIPKYYYGTCSTAASTRAKVVSCPDFVLEEGATISVVFANAQTYNGAPLLNVNETGDIVVQYKQGTNGIRYMWSAGEIIDFTYNGTNWVCHGRALATTSYYGVAKLSSSAVSTSTALAATPSTVNATMENIVTGYPVYSTSATYEIGDRVRYSTYVYECTTAITTAEAWNAEHWTTVATLQEQIDNKENTSNKVISISSSSTNKQYPSAKCVYDYIDNSGFLSFTLVEEWTE